MEKWSKEDGSTCDIYETADDDQANLDLSNPIWLYYIVPIFDNLIDYYAQ